MGRDVPNEDEKDVAEIKVLGKYLVRVPEDWGPLDEGQEAHICTHVAAWLEGRERVLVLPPGFDLAPLPVAPESVLARFAWLQGLSPGERSFVAALANDPHDKVTLAVFGDWLKEQGRETDAEMLEKTHASA